MPMKPGQLFETSGLPASLRFGDVQVSTNCLPSHRQGNNTM